MQDVDQFRGAVRAQLRALGRTQQELARALGLHPQVLSHKLHGHGRAPLTTREVLAIIRTLADWGALTTRSEVTALLKLMAVPAQALSPEAWEAPPFSSLERDEPARGPSAAPASPAWTQGSHQLRPVPLPAPTTPLIGRRAERAVVHQALAQARLVTLTGVGGTGKTRLALAVAQEATVRFADGAAFVDLAPLRDPTHLVLALARALGLAEQRAVPPEVQLTQALRARHLLLVVDNLEHLLEEAPLLARLLAAAPRLHVLATSRVPLRLYGEHEIRVPPLPLPTDDAGDGPPGDVVSSEAVQLFVARARAVCPGFAPRRRRSAPSRPSVAPSTACRWPSSWPPRASGSSRPKRCCRSCARDCAC